MSINFSKLIHFHPNTEVTQNKKLIIQSSIQTIQKQAGNGVSRRPTQG